MSDLELDIEILFSKADFNSHIEKGTIEMNNEYFNLLQEKMARIINENQELKKQLDELQTLYNNMFKCHCNRVQVETLLEQQKAFMGYLENEINTLTQGKETLAELDAGQAVSLMTLAIALEKYKKIIGGKDE